jgi:glycosyltransferase involved in cell wall biosynthesis
MAIKKSSKKIIIVSHVFATGPSQMLLEYLTKKCKVKKIIFIGHLLFYDKTKKEGSFYEIYKNGKLTSRKSIKNINMFFWLFYFKHLFFTIYWVLSFKEKYDLIISFDNLNTFSGWILKKLGRAKKVIYYTVDYVPKRFENIFANFIYHLLDRISVKKADEVWNLSPRMEIARKEFKNLTTEPNKQKVVPMGIWFDRIKRSPFDSIEKHSLVFLGHLLEKQGVQSVIKAIPEIIKKIPDFKFRIIGTGPYEENLKKLVKELKIENQVIFTGFVGSRIEVENLLSKCSCAVALYQKGDKQRNFTYYADPGKIKDYLGAGLPVILTDVAHNTRELEKNNCVVVASGTTKDIGKKIIDLMTSEQKLKLYRENAVKYAKQFDWADIFKNFVDKNL